MLTIDRAVLNLILDHARSGHPDISCGIVAGPEGSDRPDRHIPMRNAEPSRTFWQFDVLEQYKVWREMDERGEEPVVVYYSQDEPGAELSRTTLSYASEAQAHYLVISTFDPDLPVFRSFRVVNGRAVEDEITVIDDTPPQDQPWDQPEDEPEDRIGPVSGPGT